MFNIKIDPEIQGCMTVMTSLQVSENHLGLLKKLFI